MCYCTTQFSGGGCVFSHSQHFLFSFHFSDTHPVYQRESDAEVMCLCVIRNASACKIHVNEEKRIVRVCGLKAVI